MSEKELKEKQLEAMRFIRNSIMHEGKSPSVRDIMRTLGYEYPRSAALILESLMDAGYLKRTKNGDLKILKYPTRDENNAQTVDIPLVGIVSAGQPLLAEENIEDNIPVSQKLIRPHQKYFLLRVKGDSMNKAGLNDGDLVLVRQQPTAENGENVVALINDEATVKEYSRTGDKVILKPKSSNKENKPIILQEDFKIQGIVVGTIPKFEF